MITTEQWSHWKPLEELPRKFLIKNSYDSKEKLEIKLYNDDPLDKNFKQKHEQIMRIIFPHPIVFYKQVDEYCSVEDTEDLKIQYGKDFVYQSSFFKVTNSKYLQLLAEESGSTGQELQLSHFVILDFNSRVDIITTQEPLVEWIEYAD